MPITPCISKNRSLQRRLRKMTTITKASLLRQLGCLVLDVNGGVPTVDDAHQLLHADLRQSEIRARAAKTTATSGKSKV